MSHIIYHVYYSKHHNQPAYCIHNVKTSYMLDFHKFFGTWTNADKMRITRKNAWIARKITRITRIITRIIAESQNFLADAARRGRVLFAHL